MYLRTTTRKRGDKTYQSLHIVESYRTQEGKVRQRILANFGSASQYSPEQIQEIIRGLKKFYQLEDETQKSIPPTGSLDFGSTYTILRLWEEMGWTQIFKQFLRGRQFEFDVIANLKAMVANRLLDPMAKLHLLDWLEGVHLPGIDREQIDYNHLLRSLDFLIEYKEELEPKLAGPILTLFDAPLDLVFYDLTSCYFEIERADKVRNPSSEPDKPTLRNYGYDRDRSGCPQVVLGLVMTKDGIPLCHQVFSGETPDKATFQEVIHDVKARFPVHRCVVVGDRGMLSQDNLVALSEAALDYIVARPLRNNLISRQAIKATVQDIQAQIQQWKSEGTPLEEQECFREVTLDGRRFVVAYKAEIARQTQKTRQRKLAVATEYIRGRMARLKNQETGMHVPGKTLTHPETLIHLHDYLKKRQLSRYYQLRLDHQGRVVCDPDEENRRWELLIDGKLLLETTNKTLSPAEVVHQYKELQDIERCFRTLKSSLDIRPVYHWVDRRIRAHIFICVMALQLHRLMRTRLHQAKIFTSPERVLEKLAFQRTVQAEIDGKKFDGLIPPTPEQLDIFKALGVPTPHHQNLHDPMM
jgi:transposase